MPKSPTWLITGTSSGLGLSLSQHILKRGHNLISISRHPHPDASLTALSKQHEPNPPVLHHIPLDLSTATSTTVTKTITTLLSQTPPIQIDFLVNNAAITLFDAVEQTSPESLQTVMATNFFSPVYLIQSLLPHMRRSTSPSTQQTSQAADDDAAKSTQEKVIVNISSTQGLCTDASELSYDASKHALEAMSGVLAAEVAPFRIRVMVVELGSLRTKFASAGESRYKRSESGSAAEDAKGNGDAKGRVKDNDSNVADPYTDPSHPVAKRKAGVAKLASVPGLAKGDPDKTAAVLFDAVVRTQGTVVEEILEGQRRKTIDDGGNVRVERLVLGSDAQPKIERVVDRLRFDVEGCRRVSGLIEADG